MSLEDKVKEALEKRNLPDRQALKAKRKKAEEEKEQMRISHSWAGQFLVDRIKGTGYNVISHCKSCGYPWEMFKFAPIICGAKVENKQENEDINIGFTMGRITEDDE